MYQRRAGDIFYLYVGRTVVSIFAVCVLVGLASALGLTAPTWLIGIFIALSFGVLVAVPAGEDIYARLRQDKVSSKT